MLGVAEANAADDPITITIDEPDTSGGTAVVSRHGIEQPPALSGCDDRSLLSPGARPELDARQLSPQVRERPTCRGRPIWVFLQTAPTTSRSSAWTRQVRRHRSLMTALRHERRLPGGSAALDFEIGAVIELHETTTSTRDRPREGRDSARGRGRVCRGVRRSHRRRGLREACRVDVDESVGTEPLANGEASLTLTRGTRGEYRASYLGDATHEPSVSGSVLVGPGASASRANRTTEPCSRRGIWAPYTASTCGKN